MPFIFLLVGAVQAKAQYNESDWKDRDTWMKVPQLFELAGIGEGATVADIGCHDGYLSFHLAKAVGKDGKVYAVDVQEYRLDKLKEHIEQRNTTNIKVVLGDYDNPKLPEGMLDIVFVVDTYHEMDDYMKILSHIKKALKPDGRIVLLEKLKDPQRGKSREAQANAHTLAAKYVKKELEEAGFAILKEVPDFGIWNHESEKHMWILVAEKSSVE
ncbi:class I SAM-dependent methyltransferase [Maribacter algicola]|uniref:Class I SAM-dependent methyltransferase n=1 Tax=Meishania litoralis TaxID=3434685 RepID=A0ACC7LLF3_9FLAO